MHCPRCTHPLDDGAISCHCGGPALPKGPPPALAVQPSDVLAEATAIVGSVPLLPHCPDSAPCPEERKLAAGLPDVEAQSASRPAPAQSSRVQAGLAPALSLDRKTSAFTSGSWRWLVAGLIGMLVILSVFGGLQAKTFIDAQDVALTAQRQQIADLTDANLAFQDQLVAARVAEQGVRADLVTRTTERETARQERDQLAGERDQLAGRVPALQQQVSDTAQNLADANRQLTQARQSGASQQTRADSAEARNQAIAVVVALDNQIYDEFMVFLRAYDDSQQAFGRRDYFSASGSYARAQQSANRLVGLFGRRATALARV